MTFFLVVLWSNLVQDEIRRNTRYGTSPKEEEENFALFSKGRNTKGNKSQGEANSSQEVKKKDLSKIKCFNCHEFKHYATKCPHKKASKKTAGGAAGEALVSQFKLDFTLIACMGILVMGSVWYLDNSASFHMMGNNEFFSDLEEKELQIHVDMGDDGRYSVNGIGIVTF